MKTIGVDNHLNCPICSSSEFKVLEDYSTAHLKKCLSCSMVFAGRIPTATELDDHYKTYFRTRTVSPLTLLKYRELLTKFESYRHTGRILDVGCGSGFFLDVAAKAGWQAMGTEMSADAVAFCKLKELQVFKGIIEKMALHRSRN